MTKTSQQVIGIKNSRPFNPNKKLRSDKAYPCIDTLLNEFEACEGRGNTRGSKMKERLRATLETIIANVLSYSAQQYIQIPLNSTKFSNSLKLKNADINYADFKPLIKFLEKDYLESHKGYHDATTKKGKETRIKASDKLIQTCKEINLHSIATKETNLLIKKDGSKQKKLIDFDAKEKKTVSLIENIKAINKVLSSSFIDICISEKELDLALIAHEKRKEKENKGKAKKDIEKENKHKYKLNTVEPLGQQIDFSDKSVCRVFNNNSWEEGGRFYGGWWQKIPKELRPYVMIDGVSTVEVDYSSMQLAMLYHYQGLELPDSGDLYDIAGFDRGIVKQAIIILINNDKDKLSLKNLPDGTTNKDLLDTIKQKHPLIAEYFGKSMGTKLQFKDSQVAEEVLLDLANVKGKYKHSVVALPVHDSFIVTIDEKEVLEKAMYEAYKKVMEEDGIKVKVDKKPLRLSTSKVVSFSEAYKERDRLKDELYYGGYNIRKAYWEMEQGHPL